MLSVSQGRGSLGKHEYVRPRGRPLSTLSAEQVSLEACAVGNGAHRLQPLFVAALVELCLWPVDRKVVLWLVAVDVVYSCGPLSQGGGLRSLTKLGDERKR